MSNEELNERIKELETQLAEKEEKIHSLNDEIVELTATLESERRDFENQISQIAETQDKMNKERDQKISTLEKEIEEYKSLLEKKGLKELQSKLNIQKTITEKKSRELAAKTTENQKLKLEIEKLQAKLDSLKGKGVKELQDQLKKKEAEVDELHLKIVELESLQTEMLNEQKDIVDTFEKQANRIKELDAIIDKQKKEIERLSQGLDAQKLKAMDDFVQQLQNELREAKEQLANSERLRSEQAESIKRFETLLSQIETQIEQQEQHALAQAAAPSPPVPPQQPISMPTAPYSTPTPSLPATPPTTAPAQPSSYQPAPSQPIAASPAPTQQPASYPPTTTQPPTTPQSPMVPQPQVAQPSMPISMPPASDPRAKVIALLDSISDKAKSGMPAAQLGRTMEQIRTKIVEVFEWHPTLFELAAFARRLKKSPEGLGIDTDTFQLLIDKIEAWKQRILS
ncbi:MAG: hypothetical protein ACTSRS_11870 [Candidatus Helarchaeota archaeon]